MLTEPWVTIQIIDDTESTSLTDNEKFPQNPIMLKYSQ